MFLPAVRETVSSEPKHLSVFPYHCASVKKSAVFNYMLATQLGILTAAWFSASNVCMLARGLFGRNKARYRIITDCRYRALYHSSDRDKVSWHGLDYDTFLNLVICLIRVSTKERERGGGVDKKL